MTDFTVLGSGLSGALAAYGLLEGGATVTMVDIGRRDDLGTLVPDKPFSELRRTDPNQREYLIGRNLEGVPSKGVRVGAQLTPPRQVIVRESERILPGESRSFFPMMPVSLGGLGAGWGAACFTFTKAEFERVGIHEPMDAYYQKAADVVGISADRESAVAEELWGGVARQQKPLDIDSNARKILARAADAKLGELGMGLGRIPMAILSEDLDGQQRRANPYHDTDFYGDVRKSIFRPRYLVERLLENPKFRYVGGQAGVRFEDRGADGVRLHTRDVDTGAASEIDSRRLFLCAGAINTARIALASMNMGTARTTLLCNPYTYMPTVNLSMLGRAADDRRYSMAQLGGYVRNTETGMVQGCFQMYSYRALLLFKLVKEMPLPVELGLLTARVLMNALAIYGIFFADEQQATKHLSLGEAAGGDGLPVLRMEYELTAAEKDRRIRHESIFAKGLRRLRCMPFGRIDPGNAASLHYAGTVPFTNPITPRFHAEPDSTLAGAPNVYLADGASWNFLPAKGLSFTLMANALRLADQALRAQ